MFFPLEKELQNQPKPNQQAQHQGKQATAVVIPGSRLVSFASAELVVHIVIEDIMFGNRMFPFAKVYRYFNMA